jgi:membrane protein DedA with SNARE-associated domain
MAALHLGAASLTRVLAVGSRFVSTVVAGHGGLAGWVIDVVDTIGEMGVGALILLENLFPPIPSELILPLAGFRAHEGQMDLVLAWFAATIGSLTGALILYAMGALFGYDRLHELAGHRSFVMLSQRDLERGERFFERYGGKVVLLGRCIPIVRSIVSIPAGLIRMRLSKFVLYTLIGSAVWNAAFIGAGWALDDNYDRVQHWVQPAALTVLFFLLAGICIVAARKMRRERA